MASTKKLTLKNIKKVSKANAKKRGAVKTEVIEELVLAEGVELKLTTNANAVTPAAIKAEAEAHNENEHRDDPKLSPLARAYVLEAIESLARDPSPNLYKVNPDYWLTLNIRSAFLKAAIKQQGELNGTIALLEHYALDGDTILLSNVLRDIMRQTVWMGSIDTSRANRVNREYTEDQFDEDMAHGVDAEKIGRDTVAPVGLEGASDPTDNIMGFAADGERPTPPTPDEIEDAVSDVNCWLNILASEYKVFTVPYGSAPEGFSARGKQLYRNIEGPREALEMQAKANVQTMRKKAIVRANADAAERKGRLSAVVSMAK